MAFLQAFSTLPSHQNSVQPFQHKEAAHHRSFPPVRVFVGALPPVSTFSNWMKRPTSSLSMSSSFENGPDRHKLVLRGQSGLGNPFPEGLSQHLDAQDSGNRGILQEAENELLLEPAMPDPVQKKLEEELQENIQELVGRIKEQLSCIKVSRGEISVSAYDTAWVARIQDVDGGEGPQFPHTLDWIAANQHPDGSWGDKLNHWLYDRFVQTLSCIVALQSWDCSPSSVQKGVEYIQKFAGDLESDDVLRMPIGFELSFPALMAEAKSLGLDLPYDTPFFKVLEELREKKLKRVPLELLHSQPTTMLHTLEGIQSLNIDWARVLQFQSEDGSMCCSPSSTAVLYMHTRDPKCLSFLTNTLHTFDHAVPTCYPLDTFHNLWVVDTLERLGISHHFQDEIHFILTEVYKHWSDEQGICWASVLKDVPDLDDTSMAFRLLRQYGYDVSADAFSIFQKEKGFACFAVGQMVQGTSDMFNLLRASETLYPGEDILEKANQFSKSFLVDALTKKKGNVDKWSLKKDLAGEIEYALKYPAHKNLKRMEVKSYLDKYGQQDAWIGKSVYRLRLVNNYDYLSLAKADFTLCGMQHKKELLEILHWIRSSGVPDTPGVQKRVAMLFELFSADLWEQEFSKLRIAAGKCMFIAMELHQLFNHSPSSLEDLYLLTEAVRRPDPSLAQSLPKKFRACLMALSYFTNASVKESTGSPNQAGCSLMSIWGELLSTFVVEAEWQAFNNTPTEDYHAQKKSAAHGLAVVALSSVLLSGEVQDPDFVAQMTKDPTILSTRCQSILLCQITASIKNEDPGHVGTLARAEEGPDCLREGIQAPQPNQRVDNRLSLMEMGIQRISILQNQLSTVPGVLRRVMLTFSKVANIYYSGN